jgi:predicted signal transduction protein with EAL and GGDEF domain
MLRALGCDEIQGLHVAPPMKAREFEEWLERGGARHLARQYIVDASDLPDDIDGPVDDIMKWANG